MLTPEQKKQNNWGDKGESVACMRCQPKPCTCKRPSQKAIYSKLELQNRLDLSEQLARNAKTAADDRALSMALRNVKRSMVRTLKGAHPST